MTDENNQVSLDQALDQIQNWITEGDTEKARQGLSEVLEADPMNSRAQSMMNNLGASFQPEAAPNVDLGASFQPEAAPSVDLGASPQPEAAPSVDLGASFQPEAAPSVDLGASPQPEETHTLDLSQETPEPAMPVLEQMPEINPEINQSNDLNLMPDTSTELQIEEPENDINTANSVMPENNELAAAEEKLTIENPTETDPELPTPRAINKKALLIKALIPLLAAVVIGAAIFFIYQAFFSPAGEIEDNSNSIVTEEPVTNPVDETNKTQDEEEITEPSAPVEPEPTDTTEPIKVRRRPIQKPSAETETPPSTIENNTDQPTEVKEEEPSLFIF